MGPYESTCQYTVTRPEAVRQLWRLYLKPWLVILLLIMLLAGCVGTVLPGRSLLDFALVLFPAFFFFFMWRFIRRALDQHPELLEAQTLRFGASGLSITNSAVSLQWPWNRVHSITESTDFILIRLDSLGSGAVIPKRTFTDEQREAFLAYATGK